MTTDKPEERKPNKIYQNVKEWLDDIEVYSSRRERLHAELLDIDGNLDFYQVNRWLKSAWECGQEQAREQALREAVQIAESEYSSSRDASNKALRVFNKEDEAFYRGMLNATKIFKRKILSLIGDKK